MTQKSLSKLFAVSLLVALLAACSPAPSSAPPAAEATNAPAPATSPTEAAAETPASEPTTSESTTAEPSTAVTSTTETTSTEASTSTASGASAGLPAGMHTYVIVPEQSSASYGVNEEFFGLAMPKYGVAAGHSDTVGKTSNIEGQFELNWDDLSAPLGNNTFTVDLTTLKSNQNLRDNWIRENGPTFNQHPTATFVADTLTDAPTTYTPGEEVNFKMVGQLTIREITKPATFDVTAKLENGTITGTATTALKMTDFGITPPDFANTLTVQDDFVVNVEFTAQEQ